LGFGLPPAAYYRLALVQDAFPPAGAGLFDLITCRNTLIYFESATVDQVICSLRGALKPAGTLLLGAADRISTSTRLFPAGDGGVRAPRPPTTAPEHDRAGRGAPRGHDRRASPPVEAPSANPQSGLAAALSAANAGNLDRAVELIEPVLAADPMDSRALFIRGLVELASGDATAAVTSLRRVLYVRPDFGLAGFKLGQALERSGAIDSAAQAYRQALRALGRPNPQAVAVEDEIASADIALACRMRLRALGSTAAPHGNGAATGARA
jgi:tetratricopeptide (TPR) repeat protein